MTTLAQRATTLAAHEKERVRKRNCEVDIADMVDVAVQLSKEHATSALYAFCDLIEASGSQREKIAAALSAAEKDTP